MKRRAVMDLGTILACCGREGHYGRRRKRLRYMVFFVFCSSAFALNPSLDIDQYAHHAWTVRDGFFKTGILRVAQTPDGYLWLGTEFGALRFDGVRAVPWQPAADGSFPASDVYSLLGARDGRLWIGGPTGLVSWKDGKLSRYPDFAGQVVHSLVEDRDGTVWAGGTSASFTIAKLCAFRDGVPRCYLQDVRLGRSVTALYQFGGYLWVGATAGLWRWNPGPPQKYALPSPLVDHWQTFSETSIGELLIATTSGLARLAGDHIEPYSLPGAPRKIAANVLLRDRDGGLWIGTLGQGLLHVHGGRIDRFTRSDGLSNDSISALFEDREGSIWIATEGGLDRFRDAAVPTISTNQGLDTDVWAVQPANDGSIWTGARSGLDQWKDGNVTSYLTHSQPKEIPESLFQDDRGRIWASSGVGTLRFEDGHFVSIASVPAGQTHFISEDNNGDFWFGHDGSIVHMHGDAANVISSSSLGHKGNATAIRADSARGGLWIGFFEGGLVWLKDGQMRASYRPAEGLGHGEVGGIQLDRDGTIWAATEGGLSRVRNGRIATLTSRNGLPCDSVHWMMEDNDHSVWLYLNCGLVRIARSDLDAWAGDPTRIVQTTVFDISDGVPLHSGVASGYSPRVAKAKDGKLWFVSGGGVSIIDPHHLALNPLPPPVRIEQIIADRKVYEASAGLHLPPLVRDLSIDYTALSLAAPEKVHFKYKLEGQDRDWKEVINDRQVQYSNLPPRHYRFRVAASNNSGVWNETGASLDFSIDPAFYQARWFQAACVAAFLAMLWGLYRYRLHQIAERFNLRMEERVGERTRIARELHDTLLQSFQGLMLRLQVVDNLLPPGKAKDELERSLERADQALVEGRNAVKDLRSSTTISNSLAEALKDAGDELAAETGVTFRLAVEGPVRELRPIVRDEIYRISREALRNAFNHAKADRIEAEIGYTDRSLRIRIRDDGQGISPDLLKGGREGHFGLAGMRERAGRIGAKLNIWSRVGAGTEVDMTIPGSIAYEGARPRRTAV